MQLKSTQYKQDYLQDKADGIEAEKRYLFTEWADIWFENHQDNISPTTQENYRYTIRILKGAFPNRRIADIKPYDVENMLKKLRNDGRSDSCIVQCRGMMYQIMNKAEANDLIRKNPVRFAEKMKRKESVKRKEAFTAEEVMLLMELLPDDRIGWSIRLMLGTGMRTQELLALEPRHIAADGSTIEIQQAINMVKGTAVVGVPKSRDSYRTIPVPENVRYCAVNLRDTPKKYIDEGPFHGTASELLTLLSARAELQIKSANALTRLLNPQKSMLQYEYVILYNFERTGKERTLHLTRISDDDSDNTLTPGTDTVTTVT